MASVLLTDEIVSLLLSDFNFCCKSVLAVTDEPAVNNIIKISKEYVDSCLLRPHNE